MLKNGFKYRKYAVFFLCIFLLVFSLYISINYSGKDIISEFSKVIKFETVSATNTKPPAQSSTQTTKPNTGADMTQLLARLINGEARGESYQGQVAVGAVIMNRVKSPKFPNTISGVIYQKGQFSCITDGQFNKPIATNATVYKAATEALSGADPSNGALFFYNPKTAKSKWLFSLKTVATIGNHRFAKEATK
ncbi:MAG: cell wall hydrolase [Clostridia bacterium]|nr:cell wall hydrolase [Clostridia bacterium]